MPTTFEYLLKKQIRKYPKNSRIPWTYRMLRVYVNELNQEESRFSQEAEQVLRKYGRHVKDIPWSLSMVKNLLQIIGTNDLFGQLLYRIINDIERRNTIHISNIPWSKTTILLSLNALNQGPDTLYDGELTVGNLADTIYGLYSSTGSINPASFTVDDDEFTFETLVYAPSTYPNFVTLTFDEQNDFYDSNYHIGMMGKTYEVTSEGASSKFGDLELGEYIQNNEGRTLKVLFGPVPQKTSLLTTSLTVGTGVYNTGTYRGTVSPDNFTESTFPFTAEEQTVELQILELTTANWTTIFPVAQIGLRIKSNIPTSPVLVLGKVRVKINSKEYLFTPANFDLFNGQLLTANPANYAELNDYMVSNVGNPIDIEILYIDLYSF